MPTVSITAAQWNTTFEQWTVLKSSQVKSMTMMNNRRQDIYGIVYFT